MAELIVGDVKWKKGELGVQKFEIYDSDGVTRRDITGKTINFSFWKKGGSTVKGTGAVTTTDAPNGKGSYTVVANDTNTVENYIGELTEDPSGANLKSNTFNVTVEESHP